MHTREISKSSWDKMQGSCSPIFQGFGGSEKPGKWVTRLSAFLARQRCRCAASSWLGVFHRLDSRQRETEKHWRKLCPV